MSRAPAAVRETSPAAPARLPIKEPVGYLEQSALPLISLVFLTPLIIFYEAGTHLYASDPVSHTEQRIIAYSKMLEFFALFGATGRYMPAAAVVSMLLGWHLARNDRWTLHVGHLFGMLAESIAYGFPLLALGYAFQHYLPLQTEGGAWRAMIVLSVGAGVYEELVFRLAAFALLSFIFIDVLKMSKNRAALLIVLISAIAFSAYHYLGHETPEWRSFAFRTIAGIYFGAIFVFRGFGITAASHASYDITVVLLQLLRPV